MRKWSRILLAVLLLAAVLGGFFGLRPRPRKADPLYQGKPLTYWLQGFSSGPPMPTNGIAPPSYNEARSAVQHLGTNAIPTLLWILGTPDSPIKDRLLDLLRRQHYIRIPYQPQSLYQAAPQGFMVLGNTASTAVPQLMRVYEQHPSIVSRQIVPAILGQIGPSASAAIPLLVRATADGDPFVQNNSIYALGKIHGEPALTVPALTKSLEDPTDYVRMQAARALAAFGTNARPAVPALLKLLAREATNTVVVSKTSMSPGNFDTIWGPNPKAAGPFGMGSIDVIGPATNALKAIDPEAAAKAGVQ